MTQENSPPVPPLGRRSQQPDATAPDGSEIRLLVDERHQATKASLVEVTLPAGKVSRPVWHQTVEEIWYVLEGQGQVWRCPPGYESNAVEPIRVGPGDALTISTLWRFQFSADAAAPLKFLCYTCQPWPGPDEAQPAEHGGLGEGTV